MCFSLVLLVYTVFLYECVFNNAKKDRVFVGFYYYLTVTKTSTSHTSVCLYMGWLHGAVKETPAFPAVYNLYPVFL